MTIYLAILIPFITGFILLKFFKHETKWWEFFIPLLVSIALIVGSKAVSEKIQVTSDEYWGSFVDKVEYYEAWNERVSCRHPKYCTSGSGKNRTTYRCGNLHAYDVDYHPPYWQIKTTTNETVGISQGQYKGFVKKFDNQSFVNLNRNYHTKDGDKYYTKWAGDSLRATPVTTLHTYENRVKAADASIFNIGVVTDEDRVTYGLKTYPTITENYKMKAVIGDNSKDAKIADKKFQYLNAELGHKKEVKLFVLIFEDQPLEAAIYQEWDWVGANMNEFVICIGVDKERNVQWCKPFSWTENELLKTEIKEFVQEQDKLDLSEVADYVGTKIDEGFVRRDFEEFNYLTVVPPWWAVLITFIITILVNIGISYWVIVNEHNDLPNRFSARHRFRNRRWS